MWSGTFSSAKRIHLNRIGGHVGYSLVELLASIILIASIAVLALPTYQDFAPHADVAEGKVSQAAHVEQVPGTAASAEGIIQRQPETGSVGREDEESPFDAVETLADG